MDRRFGISVAIVLVPVLSLSCWLLGYAWLAYGRADDAARSVRALRITLLAMEKVSAERGPTNGLLGEDLPVPAERHAALQRMRATSDEHVAQLLNALGPEPCPGCEADLDAARRAQTHLAAARANIDRLTALPLRSRSSDDLADGVNRMIAVIPEFLPIVNARTANITRGDSDVLNYLTLARLAADLREYAGQLGSRFTGALAMHRTLTFEEQLTIERTHGRIDQLRSMIEARVGAHSALNRQALAALGTLYFSDGLRYVAAVRASASQPGGVDISPAAFAERYVPTMRAITDFRDNVLRLADDDIREHRRAMLLVLIGSAAAVLSVLGALAWMTISFRRNVVGPFAKATRLIDGIARGNLSMHIPTGFARREIRAMFEAIRVLRINSIERRRLELERAHLMRELARMAETDPLTQLLNRRAFEDRAEAMCKSPQPKAPLIALVMFDIDHFKRINDTYGHAAGDEALRTVAGLCRAEGPSADMVARIGGEEFAVMVWADSLAQARALAEHLRHRIAEVTVPTGTDLSCRMTASFGVAIARAADGPELESLLRRADHLLYAAKLAGRNCVMTDPPSASSDRSAVAG
ncbi:GGDEF domain-containing protein [Ralstonia sp. SET104]|uniref:GGDEF domain-containing protein n=1 Tax=Ralstonia sp. SET104 TaxID=2448774 RepID=UPI000F5609BA|nr:GGDEF domain-containing protein [Ralstonia sp. SET104]GCB04009.1 GGDEF domain-containing protein [Ralstonia sp. SET104]